MLYKRRNEAMLEEELFKNPTSEYRGAPLWAWNCKLDNSELMRQIECLKEMGFGGFYMHSRTGLDTPYLGKDYMQSVRDCVKKAEKENMLAWIYDEDRWPSGYAGGIVTKEKKYRQVHLLFTAEKMDEDEECVFVASYGIKLDSKGLLVKYNKNGKLGEKWYAYIIREKESPWYNNQTYVNTLDKSAILKFCQVTHERYKKEAGEDFGGGIPGFFTDEPQFTKKSTLGFASEKKPLILPWTHNLEDTFSQAYGNSLLERLPELIWDLPDGQYSVTRYHYHAHVSERFAEAYAETLGNWCESNNCLLTGHMMEEPTLKSQTAALGEVMRSLSAFELPGVDMLCDRREYTTVKQAASIAHQYGREGVLSESYGVTGWDFDFRGHKLQGDWQAALGVTARAPHLSLVSMMGEAKRDYPASLNYQVPWYKRYSLIENHFARINTAMVRGKAIIKVGVIHPVESYWLHWGPQEQSSDLRRQLEDNFKNITEWLLFNQIDFDYISESLFPRQCAKGGNPLTVGKQNYEVVIIPGCITLRQTTWERLICFAEEGGKLIIAGNTPECLDAKKDDRVMELERLGQRVGFDCYSILQSLSSVRDIDIYTSDGDRTDHLLYQMREDGVNRYLFIAHGKPPKASEENDCLTGKDVIPQENIRIVLKGRWKPVLMDTLTGEKKEIYAGYEDKTTLIPYTFFGHDSILLHLIPGIEQEGMRRERSISSFRLGRKSFEQRDACSPYWNKVDYTLSEPNVVFLDEAEYSLDGEPYLPEEEVLRIDNHLRKRLGIPLREDAYAQPWIDGNVTECHELKLRFVIKSEIYLKEIELGLENLENTIVSWNGMKLDREPIGYYVDHSIHKIRLPELIKGENVLELQQPFGKKSGIEACYLLGDFGVRVCGRDKIIFEKPTQMAFGDITSQGFPFYGGNIDYHIPVKLQKDNVYVRVSKYRGALIDVLLDDKLCGEIIFAPYQAEIKNIIPGNHRISLRLYGNRANTFGALHNCNELFWWHGPDEYRVFRDEWTYGYQLKETGILKSPEIFTDISFCK